MQISLKNNKGEIVGHATVSEVDFDQLNKTQWNLTNTGYAASGKGLMHRFIMILHDKDIIGQLVDHKNGVKLDNRYTNLSIVSYKQNAQNKHKQQKRSSDYFGITRNKRSKSFQANVQIEKQNHYIGNFENEIEAAYARDHFIVSHPDYKHLAFKLNFPENIKEYTSNPFISKVQKRQQKSSKYIGVSLKREVNLWECNVFDNNGKQKMLKRSRDEVECAKTYDVWVVKNVKNKQLNFPEDYPDYKIVKTSYKEIDENTVSLNIGKNGEECLINKSDYENIKQYICYIDRGYVKIVIGRTSFRLHRYLKNVTDPTIYVDHINHNALDNRMSNLRITNAKGNVQNSIKRTGMTSRYKGVSKDRYSWRASIILKDKTNHRRSFKLEEYAGRYRDLCILVLYPNSLYETNFKDWNQETKYAWFEKLDTDNYLRNYVSGNK